MLFSEIDFPLPEIYFNHLVLHHRQTTENADTYVIIHQRKCCRDPFFLTVFCLGKNAVSDYAI